MSPDPTAKHVNTRNPPVANEENQSCPFLNTHDKFNEAHYFLSEIVTNYHEPEPFRWSLNAFLEALRSVTFVFQKETKRTTGIAKWYGTQQQTMRVDSLLRTFVEGRNIVVKEGMLKPTSTADIGLFRGRVLKLTFGMKVSPFVPSKVLLEQAQTVLIGTILDIEHSAIGEQLGVRRRWAVEQLGNDEVVSLCDRAWARIGTFFSDAHKLVGRKYDGPPDHGHKDALPNFSILLESDVDPSLPSKWGWN